MMLGFGKIKLAHIDNLGDIQLCANQAYAKYIEKIGKKPAPMVADFLQLIEEKSVFVAVDIDGNVMGYIVFYAECHEMHLSNVAVFDQFKGQGIGKKMINFCEREAQRLQLNSVSLYTNEMMSDNLSIYPHLGYEETERKAEDGFNRVFFKKYIE